MNVRVCLVGMKTWRIENRERKIGEKLNFPLLDSERKQKRQKIERKIFLLDPNFFILPIWEEIGEEKVLNYVFYTNTLTLFVSPTPHFIHLI